MPELIQLFNGLDEALVVRDASVSDLGYVDSYVPGTLAYADNKRYLLRAKENSCISAIITSRDLASEVDTHTGLVLSPSPRELFYKAHAHWLSMSLYCYPFVGRQGVNCDIHGSALVSNLCCLGDRVKIGPGAIIEGPVRIGSDTEIHAGAKLGVDGILFYRSDAQLKRIPHGGWVDIGEGVTLFAGSTVVRSVHPSAPTVIGDGSIVGINSVVGHDAVIGSTVVVSGQCVLARRCHIGNHAYIGTQSFIREHIAVGEYAQIMAGSVVIESVESGGKVSGNYALPHHHRMLQHTKNKIGYCR